MTYVLISSESTVDFNTHCSEINLIPEHSQWKVTDHHGNSSNFDAVIVTMPTPQILGLKGTITKNIQEYKEVLESVQYSSRYALGLFYESHTVIPFPWVTKYVTENPCVRFVSVDSKKRGKGE